VPRIAGPAVLTTSVLLVNHFGVLDTAAAIIASILVVGLAFRFSGRIVRVSGTIAARISSKIAMLLLAAIAVMMVRKGIEVFVAGTSNGG